LDVLEVLIPSKSDSRWLLYKLTNKVTIASEAMNNMAITVRFLLNLFSNVVNTSSVSRMKI